MAYRIITDTGCDLGEAFYRSLSLQAVALTVNIDGQTLSCPDERQLKSFYDSLRRGAKTQTCAINPQAWAEAMQLPLAAGEDVLVLTFSSALSTTYQSARIAAEELKPQYPGRQISVVDTLCASMGQGLLVYLACQQRDAGLPLDELVRWCETQKHRLCHWFTVDDLMFLKKGGRVSAATALMGTMLQVKPILHVDPAGHLIKTGTVRGRKSSIDALAKKFGHSAIPEENDTVFISHSDCIDDAKQLEALLKNTYGVKNVIIGQIGAVIGSHSGPGTLAVFFIGKER